MIWFSPFAQYFSGKLEFILICYTDLRISFETSYKWDKNNIGKNNNVIGYEQYRKVQDDI